MVIFFAGNILAMPPAHNPVKNNTQDAGSGVAVPTTLTERSRPEVNVIGLSFPSNAARLVGSKVNIPNPGACAVTWKVKKVPLALIGVPERARKTAS